MQRTEKYFEKDAFRKSAAGVILAAEADATTGGGRNACHGLHSIVSFTASFTLYHSCN